MLQDVHRPRANTGALSQTEGCFSRRFGDYQALIMGCGDATSENGLVDSKLYNLSSDYAWRAQDSEPLQERTDLSDDPSRKLIQICSFQNPLDFVEISPILIESSSCATFHGSYGRRYQQRSA